VKRIPFVEWFDGHPWIAAIVGFFLPGIPQLLMGDILLGLIFLVLGFSRFVFAPAILIGFVSGAHAYWLSEHVYEEEDQE